MTFASHTPPPPDRRLTKASILAAAAIAALILTAAPSGTAAAQTSDQACKTQIDRENELKDLNLSFSHFMLEEARIAVRDCRVRFAETEQDRLTRERSQAGNAYANAAPFSQERRDALEAWREAEAAVKAHETANPSLAGQPYNDGLSDFERYWCVSDAETRPQAHRITTGLPHHGGSRSDNVTSVTCGH